MKKTLLSVFSASVMHGRRKKNEDKNLETLPACAVVKIKEMGNSDTYMVKFDEQGRVKETNSDFYNSLYEYYRDKIVVTEKHSSQNPPKKSVTTYTLDEQGRVIKAVYDDKTADYEYNNDGFLIKSTEKEKNGYIRTEIYTWESGNLVKIARTNSDGYYDSGITNIVVAYGNDVIKDKLVANNIFWEIYCPDWFLQDYFGKKPENAPVMKQYKGGNWSQIEIYSYTKEGNVNGYKMVKEKETQPLWEYSIDYDCN